MKYILAIVLALCGLGAQGAVINKYYCKCDTGAATGCVAGNDANSGDSPAQAKESYVGATSFITDFTAGTTSAGSTFKFCQGGWWANAVSGGNKSNANTTRANPLVVDSYDASSVWTGGAGIQPVWHSGGNFTVLAMGQGTLGAQREGYTFKNIRVISTSTNSGGAVTITLGGATGGYIFDGMTIEGGVLGIQCIGGSTSVPASGTGRTRYFTVLNSHFEDIEGIGILSGCDELLIEGNTFTRIGTTTQDHAVYISGGTIRKTPPTISSIVGNGTVVTVTTSAPHGYDANILHGVFISGVTGGTGRFNSAGISSELITVTGASTFTYYATGNGAATPGTITTVKYTWEMYNGVVRNNSFVDNHINAPGSCNLATFIVHGLWNHLLIENNFGEETVTPTSSSCMLIEIDSGAYYLLLEPEGAESFTGVVIRGNTALNFSLGIAVDGCAFCLLENNYVYSQFAGAGTGIRSRAKNFVPGAQHSGTATSADAWTLTNTGASFATVGAVRITGGTGAGQTRRVTANTGTVLTVYPPWDTTPDNTSTYVTSQGSGRDPSLQLPESVVLRYNTVRVDAPNTATGYAPIVHNCNITDDGCGSNHGLYGNLVVMENVTSTSHHCFDTTNMTAGNFAVRRDNSCYYVTSGAVPNFDPNLGTATGDVHASTASITAGQPFMTAPDTSPALGASSAALDAGHATLKPYSAWGGVKRLKSPTDRGAYERGTTTVIPNSPSGVAVQ
jgi:hypothetical protein